MNLSKIIMLICFVLLLAVPIVFRPAPSEGNRSGTAARELIIITPHNEQIRYEFGRGFDRWHREHYGEPVDVIFNVPGGTSEIRKMLESQFVAAVESGKQPGGDADLVFGGGTREHSRLKSGVEVVVNGQKRLEPISAPVDFSDEWLRDKYGENLIGSDPLFDAQRHWFGLALSGFGIVFNRDVLNAIHTDLPTDWQNLCDPKLQGWVALVNPNQSGSIATAFELLLKRSGWEEGWRILRRAGANSRYFSASSLKPPIDVSQGNAALGVCIDFFGRYQSQALREAGDLDRIGYIDPPGGTLDADPISMLQNAPHPETAKRFIEFCLSDEGQALWQFPKRGENVSAEDQLGPERFELRRMPIVRSIYSRYFHRLIDQVNPFELAKAAVYPDPNFRDFIGPLFAAMVMDSHHELKAAWRVITDQAAVSTGDGLLKTSDATDPTLRQMLDLFDAMPSISGPQGKTYSLTDAGNLGEVRNGWLRGKWSGQGLWPEDASAADEMRREFSAFFQDNYRRIVALAETEQRDK